MVTLLSGPLVDLGPDLIGAAVLFAASGTLTWHGWWMRQHARAVRGELEQRIDAAHARQQFWVVGVIAFTGVFREGAETVLFLWGLLTQIGTHAGGSLLALGGVAGRRRRRGARDARVPGRAPGESPALLRVDDRLPAAPGGGPVQHRRRPSPGPRRLCRPRTRSGTRRPGSTTAASSDRSWRGCSATARAPPRWEAVAYVAYLLVAGWLLFGRRRPAPSTTLGRGRRPTLDAAAAPSASRPAARGASRRPPGFPRFLRLDLRAESPRQVAVEVRAAGVRQHVLQPGAALEVDDGELPHAARSRGPPAWPALGDPPAVPRTRAGAARSRTATSSRARSSTWPSRARARCPRRSARHRPPGPAGRRAPCPSRR